MRFFALATAAVLAMSAPGCAPFIPAPVGTIVGVGTGTLAGAVATRHGHKDPAWVNEVTFAAFVLVGTAVGVAGDLGLFAPDMPCYCSGE